MILGFKTQINGKPTYFVEKIITYLVFNKLISFDEANDFMWDKLIRKCNKKGVLQSYLIKIDRSVIHIPKLHTIREDKNNRWKVGTKIDFFINARQPNMYRFAPVLQVVSTQKIEFIWKDNTENLTCIGMRYDKTCTIMIDNRFFGDVLLLKGSIVSGSDNLPSFAQNDGFDTLQDMLDYFNKNFKGKIIHWTEKRY
jgi:hypothetical protein